MQSDAEVDTQRRSSSLARRRHSGWPHHRPHRGACHPKEGSAVVSERKRIRSRIDTEPRFSGLGKKQSRGLGRHWGQSAVGGNQWWCWPSQATVDTVGCLRCCKGTTAVLAILWQGSGRWRCTASAPTTVSATTTARSSASCRSPGLWTRYSAQY